jgi:hypothetical protein
VESLHKKLKTQSYDDIQDNVTNMDDNECEVNVRVGNGENMVAQEEESQEVVLEGRNAGGLHRSIWYQANEYIGQISEKNRLEVEERGDPIKKLRKPRGGNRNRNRRCVISTF